MNRWSFLTVLVVVVGAVVGFAIYTFSWRGDSNDGPHTAKAYAEAVAAACDPSACQVTSLVRISGNDWKVVLRNPTSGRVGCALIQTKRFAPRAGGDFAGASRMKCAEARSAMRSTTNPSSAVGAAWWSESEAEQKVAHSRWVFDNGISGAVFSCLGQGESQADGVFRRFACTYESGGSNVDQSGRLLIATTGPDSFSVVSK